ncbi:MAG TPA: nuclear transport factor 2 family protein [Flavobacterium sp.]|jgi:hypothetical protein
MRKLLIIILIVCGQFAGAQEADVRKAVEDFFTAFHAQDTTKLRLAVAKEMVLHSVTETPSGNRFSEEDANDFIKSIASIPKPMKFEERLMSFEIKIDGPMAHAWTPYEFYVNGKLSHKGVNSFQLFKDGLQWKVVYIIDTRRKG